MKKILFLYAMTILVACSPKVTTNIQNSTGPLDYTENVIVLTTADDVPAGALVIGTLKVSESGMTVKCSWEHVIEKAKTEARKSGGNILKITEHKRPDMMSTCHRIKATIYKVGDKADLANIKTGLIGTKDTTWDYALLYVYRPGGMGSLVGYDLYLGDSLICRVKNNFKQEIKIYKSGLNTLWAKTESKEEVPIDIEFGREYYLRCGLGMGVMVGRPKMELVNRSTGISEYDKIKSKKK